MMKKNKLKQQKSQFSFGDTTSFTEATNTTEINEGTTPPYM